MADDMTPGEIRRTFERIERQQQEGQRAVDDRITRLAADSVPTVLWASEHKAVLDDVQHNAEDMRQGFDRVEKTSLERVAALRTEIAGVRGEVAAVRKGLGEHNKKHETDNSWSRSKWLTIIGIVVAASATIVGAWIAAAAAAGGVR